MEFKDKVVLITGASSGIGSAIAVAFAQQGAAVSLVGRNVVRLAKTAEQCQRYGHKTLTVKADFTSDEEIAGAVETTVQALGRLDVLVNGVGCGATSLFQDGGSLQVFDDVIKANLYSTVVCSHKAVPHLVKSKGNIVNVSSICGTNVIPITSWAYCVAKAGVDHFTRCIASELGPQGVRVNSVNPGAVKTNFWSYTGADSKLFDAMKDSSPLRQICEPQEVADLVLYVAGAKARSITGSAFVIDNGFKVKK